jgi:hypothetical protein
MPLLAAPYDAVRALLDTSLTASELPDATVALDPFAPAAGRWVLERVPNAESLTGDDLQRAKDAAAYEAAARLAPALPSLTREELTGVAQVQRAAVDRQAQAAELHGRAVATLAGITTQQYAPAKPTFIAAACGGRGR